MNQNIRLLQPLCYVLAMTAMFTAYANNPTVSIKTEANKSAPIPMDQLGAVAGKQYQGDGLTVSATPDGARLRCAFQRLEGQVTREGLWLSSTAEGSSGERFRVMAMQVGRVTPCVPLEDFGFDFINPLTRPSATLSQLDEERDGFRFSRSYTSRFEPPNQEHLLSRPSATLSSIRNGGEGRGEEALRFMGRGLPRSGLVNVTENVARFIRPGLTEEYSVSVDGVRQDFIIEQQPTGDGELRVELEVTGAKAEPLLNGARLVLDGSGRKLAYNRLRVVDATGRELPARMEVISVGDEDHNSRGERLPMGNNSVAGLGSQTSLKLCSNAGNQVEEMSLLTSSPTNRRSKLAVVVNDAAAIYPVRIDPTFSDANWVSLGGINGADNAVYAAAVEDSGNLYIGGSFTVVGDVVANRIAKWNGTNWSALGSGMNYHVYALAVSGSDLYAGGTFNYVTNSGQTAVLVNRIAKWDGATWTALGVGFGGTPGFGYGVYALAVSGSDLYAGGDFTYATNAGPTSVLVNRIAKWNGNNWSALGSGMFGGTPFPTVYALAVSGSDLYAGGAFTTAGDRAANGIAKWNGSSWSELGAGISGPGPLPFDGSTVYALAVSGSNVFVGGRFSTAAGSPANHIAKWDSSTWSTLGSGMNNRVAALVASGNNLYVGGDFTMATNSIGEAVAVNRIAKWNGSAWSPLGMGVNDAVSALAVSGSNVFAGGSFTTADGNAANYIAQWNGSAWSAALSSGLDNSVRALAVSGSDVYAGGIFAMVGGTVANHIAKWNGSAWSPLGMGVNDAVSALAVSGSNVFAGGSFTTAGGNAANYIAQWNGSAWSALGSGLNGQVDALAISGSDLYAGGNFWGAAGVVGTRGIAKWDGSSWSALGSGIDGAVYALALSGGDIYVGGWFQEVYNSGYVQVPAKGIAKWDGNGWSALGPGLNGQVDALAISGSNVYAGGRFSEVGGSAGNYIAKWNGTTWTALGSGLGKDDQFSSPFPYVYALAVADNNVYAGGDFTTAGGVAAKYIAKWNGTNWSAMGSGMNNSVLALAVSGNDVYVGGGFTTAGGNAVGYAAKTIVYPLAFDVLSISNGTFWAVLTGPVSNNVIVDGTTNFSNWFPVATNTLPPGGAWQLSIPIGTNSHQFYRARLYP